MSSFITTEISECPNDEDLRTILAWLKQEYDCEGEGFWATKNIIEQAHKEGSLLVLREDKQSVAFQLGRLISPGILVVRPDRRGRGYGRRLVEYCIDEARQKNRCLLHIQCEPSSSIPFWKKMGFTLFTERAGGPWYLPGYAFMLLGKELMLPEGCERARITTEFYPFGAEYRENIAPLSRWDTKACAVDGGFLLGERVTGFSPRAGGRLVVQIQVNGERVYFGRAKDAEHLGVQRDGDAFFLERLKLAGPA